MVEQLSSRITEKGTYIPESIALTVNVCPIFGAGTCLGLLLGLLGRLCGPFIAAGVVAHDETRAALAHFAGGVEM